MMQLGRSTGKTPTPAPTTLEAEEQPTLSRPERPIDIARRRVFEILKANTTLKLASHWGSQIRKLSTFTQADLDVRHMMHSLGSLLGKELIVSIYPPGKIDRTVSRQIHNIQESVKLSDYDQMFEERRSGYLRADSVEEIQRRSAKEGAWYMTISDAKRNYYAYYSQQILSGEEIRPADRELGESLRPDNLINALEDLDKVSINHEIAMRVPKSKKAPEILEAIKPSISAILNLLAMAIEYKANVVVSFGTCRSWNQAIRSHLEAGWEQLNPKVFVHPEEIPVPTFGAENLEFNTIVWNTPTKRHAKLAKSLLGLTITPSLFQSVTHLTLTRPA